MAETNTVKRFHSWDKNHYFGYLRIAHPSR